MRLRELPEDPDHRIDEKAWITSLAGRGHAGPEIRERLGQAVAFARTHLAALGEQRADRQLRTGLEIADIVSDLEADATTLVAALTYRVMRSDVVDFATLKAELGEDVAAVCDGAVRMGSISLARLVHPSDESDGSGAPNTSDASAVVARSDREGAAGSGHLDSLRRMLVSMIDDSRVPVVKLAERTAALRAAVRNLDPSRDRLAREARDIFAPLANRLGINRIRWELEDMAFRCLQESDYRQVALLLGSRRADRETDAERLAGQIAALLVDQLPDVRVEGRAKHLYSIWRKMRDKGLSFAEIYDVRAVRVMVTEVSHCYIALGILHAQLGHLQHELDDYIASPKSNGYRSLHTAVIGPDGGVMEIQIRTEEMHADAELGVCAHWAYKTVGGQSLGENYETKLAWLRELLDHPEETPTAAQLSQRVVEGFAGEAVHVLTRDGDVLELPPGATPVDFAYRLHTEIGHRCYGALVDSSSVPLNTVLENGQHVEVITGDRDGPPLEWLDGRNGFIATSRARNSVRSWLRALPVERSRQLGRRWLQGQLAVLGPRGPSLGARLAERLQYAEEEALWLAIGRADCPTAKVIETLDELRAERPAATQLDLKIPAGADGGDGEERLQVSGAGTMPAYRAHCCEPAEGEAIAGLIEGPRLLVHRADCAMLHNNGHVDVAALVPVEWGGTVLDETVELRVIAYDRPAILRDITRVLAVGEVDLTDLVVKHDQPRGQLQFDLLIRVAALHTATRLVQELHSIANVIDVRHGAGDDAQAY